MAKWGLWLRWSWRDLRERWMQVGAVALIIALGTGVYAGLGSTTPWRHEGTDASYKLLNMSDMRLRLLPGSYVDAQQFVQAVLSVEHADWIKAAEPRLFLPQHVDAGKDILVRGQVIGLDLSDGGPQISKLYIKRGRDLNAGDSGQNIAILEQQFAAYYHLPAQGEVQLDGGVTMKYVGVGNTPEYFFVTTDDGGMMAQAGFAVVFTSLETAQNLAGLPGKANDLVITLSKDADQDVLSDEIKQALSTAFPGTTVNVIPRQDDPIVKMTYHLIDMNQQIYNVIILLFWAGAALGAFNLTSRIIESQRRQIGIGIALGMPPRLLVLRPLLIGAQIALLGALLGAGIGVAFAEVTGNWMRSVMPLPAYGRVLHIDYLVRGAAIGFGLAFLACLYPVWRAVRVAPIDAIKTGHLVKTSSGWASLALGLPLPGKSFSQIPVRYLLRAPRRTLLTILGVATAITTLTSLLGMLDTIHLEIQKMKDELYQNHPDRMVVYLDRPYAADAPQVQNIVNSPALSQTEVGLTGSGNLIHGDTKFPVFMTGLPLGSPLWSPTVVRGKAPVGVPGVLIAQKAANDLGVDVGDTITLEHPRREGMFAYQMVKTDLVVTGIHAYTWRNYVYMDIETARQIMNAEGMVTEVNVAPAASVSQQEAKRQLFEQMQGGSIVSMREAFESVKVAIGEVARFLTSVSFAVVILAFLIAFNSTSINLGEREREIATMFAFGLPLWIVAGMVMLENLLVGLLGTLIGMIAGYTVERWFFIHQMPTIMPEQLFPITVSPLTIVLAVLVGVVLMALTPLVTVRRMARMDIPAALRVME